MRSTRRITAAVLSATVVGAGIAVGIASAHDARTDEANTFLVKAAALLEVSSPQTTDPRAQRKFERAINRAIRDVQKAQEQIVKANDADDNS